jgi:hypothetical protein
LAARALSRSTPVAIPVLLAERQHRVALIWRAGSRATPRYICRIGLRIGNTERSGVQPVRVTEPNKVGVIFYPVLPA